MSEGEKDSVRLSAPLLNLIQGHTTPQGPLEGIWRLTELPMDTGTIAEAIMKAVARDGPDPDENMRLAFEL